MYNLIVGVLKKSLPIYLWQSVIMLLDHL